MQIHRILPVDALKDTSPVKYKKRKSIQIFNGPNPTTGGHLTKYSDNIIMEIRRLSEYKNISEIDIVEFFLSNKVSMTIIDVRRYISYASKSQLVPDDTDTPYWISD